MNYTIETQSGYYYISGKDVDLQSTPSSAGPYNPFTACEDCPAFDSSDPYEENDVVPFVDCEEVVITDPYIDCENDLPDIPVSITSTPYPVITKESSIISSAAITIVDMHRTFLEETSLEERSQILDFDILSGIFRSLVYSYSLFEQIEIKDFDIISAVFRAMIKVYTVPPESLEIKSVNLLNGVFRIMLIDYTYGLPENLEIKNNNIIGGTHATA